MITYTYLCTVCGEIEHKQSITSTVLKSCPFCESTDLKKVITRSNFSLKGSGWAGKDSKADSLFQARID